VGIVIPVLGIDDENVGWRELVNAAEDGTFARHHSES
jgi:hypothetical protein